MATYYDGLNYAFKLFENDPPTSSAQLIFLHLLHENNRHGNTGAVTISDRELGHRTRLSKQTITEAKRTLKNRGLIDFHTDRDKSKAPTNYTLPFFTLGQEVGQEVGHEVGQTLGHKVGREGFVSYTAHAKDLKTKDFKTKDDDDASARAIQEKPNVEEKPSQADVTEIDVHELWKSLAGYQLFGDKALELERLEREYTRESFHTALIKAVETKKKQGQKINLPYFKAILEAKKGDKASEKRGRFSVRAVQREYDKPDARQYPWDDDGRKGEA